MARQSGNCLRCCLVIFAVVSALCVSGPAIYWKFKKLKVKAAQSCMPCKCDCSPPLSLLEVAPGMSFLDPSLCFILNKDHVFIVFFLFGVSLFD